jgi:hypothetical protein
MLSRNHSNRICTCVQFLHSADVVAYVVVRQEWVQMSILWIADVRPNCDGQFKGSTTL